MKKQIRSGTFETNSSSVHAITMCTEEDYKKWKTGELIWCRWDEKLIKRTPESEEYFGDEFLTYEQFDEFAEYETFVEGFKTPSGEKVIAFGYYGSDY